MGETIDVDKIWRALGPFKRYSVIQIFYAFFICVYSAGFPMIVYVYVGYSPTHRCKELSHDLYTYGLSEAYNTSYNVITYESCQTVIAVNGSNGTNVINVPCLEGYDYDIEVDTFVTEWNLVCDKSGLGELTQTIWTAGQAVGCLVFPSIADRYGRKRLTIICMALLTGFGIAASFGNYLMYIILRFITGAFQQGFGLTLAVLIVEQLPMENRGFVSSLGSLAWGLNVIIVAGIGYFMRNVSWRYYQMASGLVGVHVIASFWLLDESVRWLIANKRIKEAKVIIEKVAKFNNVDLNEVLPILDVGTEDVEIKPLTEPTPEENIPLEIHKAKKEDIYTILKHRTLLKTTAVMSFAWLTNALVYYGLMLTSTQLAGDRYLNFFINVAVELPAMISFVFLVKRLKRKQLSVLYHTIAGVSLIASVILSTFKGRNSNFEKASVVFSFIGKFGITGSFSTIFLWTPELYPTNLRNIGLGLASIVARFGGMFAPYATTLATYVAWGPGIIFGVCCVIATLLQLLLPETSGKKLPQTVQELREWDAQKSNGINEHTNSL